MTRKQKLKRNVPRARRSHAENDSWTKRIGIFNKIIFSFILISGVYYVANINDLSIRGFILQEKKLKIMEIEKLNKDLELRAMSLESYETVNKKAAEMKMVKVSDIEYISVIEDSMAKK